MPSFFHLMGGNHTSSSLLNIFHGVFDSLLRSVKVAFLPRLGGRGVGKLLAHGLVIA